MTADRDTNTIVIPIPPTAYKTVGGLVGRLEVICNKLGYGIIKVGINKDKYALEIHVQTRPDTVTLVETTDDISQSLRQYIEQYQAPTIEILPSPIAATAVPRATQRKIKSNYNHMQNAKYNTARRNYKGRKR